MYINDILAPGIQKDLWMSQGKAAISASPPGMHCCAFVLVSAELNSLRQLSNKEKAHPFLVLFDTVTLVTVLTVEKEPNSVTTSVTS